MILSPRLRVALGLTLAACAAVALLEPPAEAPTAPARSERRAAATRAPAAAPSASAAWPDGPRSGGAAWPALSASAVAAWSVPAPPPVPAAVPVRTAAAVAVAASAAALPTAAPAPEAPPFPYQLIGRLEEGSSVQALLLGPQRTLGARVGDVIDGQWRVESVDAAGLSITWIPGSLRRTVGFPSS